MTVRLIVVEASGMVLLSTPVTVIVRGIFQSRPVNVNWERSMVATAVLLLRRSITTLPEAGAADSDTVNVAVPFSATVTDDGLAIIAATFV